ncbi:MAG: hypothetical protein E1N59_598 [Puniceicoccaceae bacterium 5H]|nr:MAG: hypothetical protein E1N59_598 [Puniceicoccaceae bacterium 5H]
MSGAYGGAGGIGGLQAIEDTDGELYVPAYERDGNLMLL